MLEESILIGVVTQKQEADGSDKYPSPTTFVELAGSVRLMVQGQKVAAKLPAVGAVGAFEVRSTRSGRAAVITQWGWPAVGGAGSLNKTGEVLIKWMGQFNGNGNGSVETGVTE